MRVMFHHPYAIYYMSQTDAVVIVRVIHGAQDIDAIVARGELV